MGEIIERHWREATLSYTPQGKHKCLGPIEIINGKRQAFDNYVIPGGEFFPWEEIPEIPFVEAYQVERLSWGKAVEVHRVAFDAETGKEMVRYRFGMGGNFLAMHVNTFEGVRIYKYCPEAQRYYDATPTPKEPLPVQGTLNF